MEHVNQGSAEIDAMLGMWRGVSQGLDDVNGDEENPLPARRQLGSGVPVGLGAGFTPEDLTAAVAQWLPGAYVHEGMDGEIEILTGLTVRGDLLVDAPWPTA